MPPVRLERTTRGLKVRCCYQLSYGGGDDASTYAKLRNEKEWRCLTY